MTVLFLCCKNCTILFKTEYKWRYLWTFIYEYISVAVVTFQGLHFDELVRCDCGNLYPFAVLGTKTHVFFCSNLLTGFTAHLLKSVSQWRRRGRCEVYTVELVTPRDSPRHLWSSRVTPESHRQSSRSALVRKELTVPCQGSR